MEIIINNDENKFFINSKFNHYQISQIRLGFDTGLDISKYANPNFTESKMHEIRFDLLNVVER